MSMAANVSCILAALGAGYGYILIDKVDDLGKSVAALGQCQYEQQHTSAPRQRQQVLQVHGGPRAK